MLLGPMGANLGTKTKFIPLDLHFELVTQLGYQLLNPGSLGQFLVTSVCWTTTK